MSAPTITIERLEAILYRETAVIAEEDVPILMEIIRDEAAGA